MSWRIARWITLCAIALFAAWAGYRVSHGPALQDDGDAHNALNQLTTAPLSDLDGHPRALTDWSGKLLVVNLWATWCPPCKQEMPAFDRIHRKLSGNGVQFVGIAIDDPAAVKEFATHHPVSFPQLLGDAQLLALTKAFGNSLQGLPFTLILDQRGQIVASHLGRWSESDLSDRLATLLQH